MKSTRVRKTFIELRASGHSYDEIVKTLCVSKPTLIKWGKEYDHEIREMAKSELLEAVEKHRLTVIGRINLFGEHIKRINDEILKRNLTDISTDNLINLQIKMVNGARKDAETILATDDTDDSLKAWEKIMVRIMERDK